MSVPFDPGYSELTQDLWSIAYTVEEDLQSMSQLPRKTRYYNACFPRLYKALLNTIAFYKGCMAWAFYIINKCPDEVITGNPFLNMSEEKKSDYAPCDGIDFLIEYLAKFESDVKYYRVKNAQIPQNTKDVLKIYREFIAINEGFINTGKVSDLKTVDNMNFSIPLEEIKMIIDKAISEKNLSLLLSL